MTRYRLHTYRTLRRAGRTRLDALALAWDAGR